MHTLVIQKIQPPFFYFTPKEIIREFRKESTMRGRKIIGNRNAKKRVRILFGRTFSGRIELICLSSYRSRQRVWKQGYYMSWCDESDSFRERGQQQGDSGTSGRVKVCVDGINSVVRRKDLSRGVGPHESILLLGHKNARESEMKIRILHCDAMLVYWLVPQARTISTTPFWHINSSAVYLIL